jgi:hypothetical protein
VLSPTCCMHKEEEFYSTSHFASDSSIVIVCHLLQSRKNVSSSFVNTGNIASGTRSLNSCSNYKWPIKENWSHPPTIKELQAPAEDSFSHWAWQLFFFSYWRPSVFSRATVCIPPSPPTFQPFLHFVTPVLVNQTRTLEIMQSQGTLWEIQGLHDVIKICLQNLQSPRLNWTRLSLMPSFALSASVWSLLQEGMHKPIVSWPMSTLNWYLKTKSKPEITLGLMYGREKIHQWEIIVGWSTRLSQIPRNVQCNIRI